MSDNSWYENDELPPVGSKAVVDSAECTDEYTRSFNGMAVDIVLHMTDHRGDNIAVFSMIDPEDRDCLKFHGMMKRSFLPLKSKRQIAIEDMAMLICKSTCMTHPFYMSAAQRLYDAGYRKSAPATSD